MLPVPKTGVATTAKSSKLATPTIELRFLKNVPNGADSGVIEVEQPQTYTFLRKYPKHLIMATHCEEDNKKVFDVQLTGEDSDDNGSDDEDPSRVYQEIEPDDNKKMCQIKKAHNAKVK